MPESGLASAGRADPETTLYGEERQAAIVDMARRDRRVSVATLAETFGVATETIRRDLSLLERHGLVKRVHGGAILPQIGESELAIQERAQVMTVEKERIAKAALAELPDEGTIFIEAGSTPAHLADLLPLDREMTVVTNGSYIATSLAQRANLTVIAVGGRVRWKTLACVDDWALQTLAGLFVDVAFLGTNGISVDRGLTTPDHAEAAVKRATLRLSRWRVLLADQTKMGAVSLFRYGEVADLDVVITDSGVSDEVADEIEAAGPRVLQA
ncbi:MAG: DeoR/GlpR family DNA-binding transcription regulator [Acidimicrobiales bacterium]